MKRLLLLLASGGLLLAACTEQPQTIGTRVHDQAPYAGATGEAAAFMAGSWTANDKKSWQEQLRVRTQRGQNEYNRL